jgi:hypothetical protein
MSEGETVDVQLAFLFDRYATYTVENSLRGGIVFPTKPIIQEIASIIREQGEPGRQRLRQMLVMEQGRLDASEGCASHVLAELNDGPSLKPLLALADQMWAGGQSDLGISSLYDDARKMVANAYKQSLIDDEVIGYVVTSIEKTGDWRAVSSFMETAALFKDDRIKDALIQQVSNPTMQAAGIPAEYRDKRAAAVYALRKFPGVQPLMISLLDWPEREVADKAARALVELLDLIPGNRAASYEEWKAWAETRVTPELRPVYPKGIKRIFSKDPQLTRPQIIFWTECRRAWQGAN